MWFSRKRGGQSVAIIEIDADSIAGGFVHTEGGKPPVLCYTVRLPYELRDEQHAREEAMLRAIQDLGDRFVREGAPALRQATGSGSVDQVIVSVGSPWQEAKIENRQLQKPEPFTFTRALEQEILGKGPDEGDAHHTRTVITTLLNGYRTREPYGKQTRRAELVVLCSTIDARAVAAVDGMLASTFHTREVTYTSFAEPYYRVLRDLYPLEKDFLVMSIEEDAIEVASIKRGHLLDTGAVACGARGLAAGDDCLKTFTDRMRSIATRHALPRNLFLKGEESHRALLTKALDDAALHALWLSDEPVNVIPLLPSQFSSALKVVGQAEGDVGLTVLALYAADLLAPSH